MFEFFDCYVQPGLIPTSSRCSGSHAKHRTTPAQFIHFTSEPARTFLFLAHTGGNSAKATKIETGNRDEFNQSVDTNYAVQQHELRHQERR